MPGDLEKQLVFKLAYLQHGGSGLGFQPSEVLEMSLEDALWHSERLDETRREEADAIRQASKVRK